MYISLYIIDIPSLICEKYGINCMSSADPECRAQDPFSNCS